MLHDALLRIASEYPAAVREPLKGNPLAAYIRTELPRTLAKIVHEHDGLGDMLVEATKFLGTLTKCSSARCCWDGCSI